MDSKILAKLIQLRAQRKACVVVTRIKSGESTLVAEDRIPQGSIGAQVAQALRSGKSGLAMLNEEEMFFNVYAPMPRIVVIGAVHISQALVSIAKTAGFEIEIIDPRTAFATTDRFNDVILHAEWPGDVLAKRPLDAYTALAAVTHDPKIDDVALLEAIKAECFYIGALGSRKTHAARQERLIAEGATVEELSQIAAPIGLDIGASNPAEIAVAIMAEIIEAFRRREIGLTSQSSAA